MKNLEDRYVPTPNGARTIIEFVKNSEYRCLPNLHDDDAIAYLKKAARIYDKASRDLCLELIEKLIYANNRLEERRSESKAIAEVLVALNEELKEKQ